MGQTRRHVSRAISLIFPQWLKTAVVTLLWLALMLPWVSVTSLYSRFGSGLMVGVGLALFAAIAAHVWPTRTPPWRTVAITAVFTTWLGSTLLIAGLAGYALNITGLVGCLIVLVRINENGRKTVRALLRRPLATKV
jgi:hypothetical protein